MVEEQIQQNRVKASDEIFCRTCGVIIKKQAEICPHCGVRNIISAPSYIYKHNPTLHTTSVSGNWYSGIIISTVLWIVSLVSVSFVPEGSTASPLIGFVILLAWISLPLALYFDIQYVKGNNDKWNPDTTLWVLGGFIWLVNLIVVLIYIIRRKESMDLHSAISTS